MPKRFGHFCLHFSAFSLKLSGLLCVLVAVLIGIFVWRVSRAPLDIGFAKDYIQSSLHDDATGNYASMDKVVLYWPDLKGPLFLQLQGGRLMKKDGSLILSVDTAALSFSRAGLLTGRILPKSIILKQPTLLLTRNEDGRIELDLGQPKPDDDKDEQLALTTRIFGYIARPGEESEERSLISRLESFSIENARLAIDDKIAKQSWTLPDFNVGLYSTEGGMRGVVDLQLPDIGGESSALHIDMNYAWGQKNLALAADFKNIDVQAIAGKVPEFAALGKQNMVLNAHVETILDEGFMPSDILIDVQSDSGSFMYPDLSDKAIPYKDFALHASYSYAGHGLVLQDTHVTLNDVTVFAKAEIKHEGERFSGPVKLWIDSVDQSQIDPLWPKVLRGDVSEKWIVHRMSKGRFKDVSVSFDALVAKVVGPAIQGGTLSWGAHVEDLVAGFGFEGMSLDYRAPLDAANDLEGVGRFDRNKDEIIIDITKGNLGVMPVTGVKLLFDKVVAEGEGGVDIQMGLKTSVPDVLRFLSKEPINLGDDMKLDITKTKGRADLKIGLKFPTRKDVQLKDFEISVSGTLGDLFLPDVVKTLDLSGKSLAISVKNGAVSLKGDAMLDSRPMDFLWDAFLEKKGKPYKEKITAKITADPNLRSALGIDLGDFLEGTLPVDVTYISYDDGHSVADVVADLTPARFFVEPFEFEKPPTQSGNAILKAHLKGGVLEKITDIAAEGEGFKITKADVIFKKKGEDLKLSSGSIGSFSLAETKGALNFVYDAQGAVKIVMDMDFLDAQPFMTGKEDKKEYTAPPMMISVSAKTMRTAPDETMSAAKIFMDIDGQGLFNQMEMDAKVGAGTAFVRFKPDQEGKRTFRMKSDDAGAFLKALGIYKNIRGGQMIIYGEPVRGVMDRDLRGVAEITNFKVVKAPALTKILSILSLSGIGEVLGNDGLHFEKLEAGFSWIFRKGGSLLVLKDGRTSGNSLGLVFDGTFDNQKHDVDVSGTIVPMSGINKIIGSIPLVGDILTGGSGGVFAATYSIKGSTDNPEIFVNPLSVLTPGILRRVLWE